GLEPQLNVGRGDPDIWHTFVEGWRTLGATHLCLSTMGNGFTSPAQHVAALTRAATELDVGAE
ncbi:MAG: LLM class F420-dependent oxidoreductase, partial [Chloroflexota bacterium]|nr:LLM class F420-dependent oxidoreductase [Chloroflexota bacterium]